MFIDVSQQSYTNSVRKINMDGTKRNTVNPKVISPYDLNDHSGIRFRMDITGEVY